MAEPFDLAVTCSGPTSLTSSWLGAYYQTRLDTAASPVGAFSFFYDPLNRLTGYRAPFGGSYDDRYYDGDDVVLQFRRPASAPSGQWVRTVHGPNDDQPLAMEIYPAGAAPTPGSGSVYYYHADAEGSVRLITDASAQVVNRYEYDTHSPSGPTA